jgi:TRAP transporter TAXI family solute receptor
MPSPSRSEEAARQRRRSRRHALVVWSWILGLCAAALIATYVMFVEPPPPHRIVIASGGRDGAYFRFAQKYAGELRRDGVSVDVRETAGSVENLRLLTERDSDVAVAIVQSGVAGAEDLKNVLALGSLYHEPLWVFYRGDERFGRLSQLAGKRIGVGPKGSGTYAIATRLLTVSGRLDSQSSQEGARDVLVQESMADTAKALQKGELDAAFFVAAFEADYIQALLSDPSVKLLSFHQHEAYRRRFRFLAPVTVPAGLANLGRNIPERDAVLLAPTAMLVVRKDFHPALVPLLLVAATRIHGAGDELSEPAEFPSESFCDFPISDDAKRFYRSGQPMLQRLLPFWLASLADRAKVMLIPLVMLMMPLFRAAPPLLRWRTRRKIYRWYSYLREIDQKLHSSLSEAELDQALARLGHIEHQVAYVDVPLGYMEEFYHLRMHINMLQQRLLEVRSRDERIAAGANRSEAGRSVP